MSLSGRLFLTLVLTTFIVGVARISELMQAASNYLNALAIQAVR